ncbi:OLC1v1033976C1 [Oldenlandia corymbosa var. corymbosa]|uniref:OLC1v1033976C1 n=1 Tax=Oldenlandia corymbosa var. corymbosa TaxID=529605 RepID=A0AAV1CSF8_OLDCO|nr:OLC1v1033976C1 [Oldenlandia corymbosa var. corymbosa]
MGTIQPHVVEDCCGIVQLYSDGTIFRSKDLKLDFPVHDDGSVLWKDYLFHQTHDLHLRLYKPAPPTTSAAAKLSVVFFMHGGGFCVGSRTWPNFHNCCMRLCSGLQAVVIAPDYRLAPEHRLPAALEDSLSALKWLQSQTINNKNDDDGVPPVDVDRVYVLGDSSGGNLAHHLAVQLGPGSPELAPVRVRGYVLMAPFFGGTVRTKSEVEGPPEPLLTLELLDCFWRLSLPIGETADHPLANPFGPLSPSLESVILDPLLVIVGGGELMKDRVENYANKLKELGKEVKYLEFQGKPHAFFTNDPYSDVSSEVLKQIKSFISQITQIS